mgnify:CR=1 FL=1
MNAIVVEKLVVDALFGETLVMEEPEPGPDSFCICACMCPDKLLRSGDAAGTSSTESF